MTAPEAHPRRWRLIAKVGSLALAVVLAATGIGGYLIYRHLDSNITAGSTEADHELRPSTSATTTGLAPGGPPQQAVNILALGSDTRVAQGGEGGSAAVYRTAQSDVVMLIHLSADRTRALVLSIPRDTWVRLPPCNKHPAHDGKFNEAFTLGGAACTIKLFREFTGIDVDHYVIIDFNGVKQMIDAVGGVHVCLKSAMSDPVVDHHGSGLDLPAGDQIVKGEQGLAFLRARNYGMADIDRLDHQHEFLGAMVKQIQDAATLTNLPQLYRLLDAATQAITVDRGLDSLLKLKDLAQSIAGLKPSQVTFVTMPWLVRPNSEDVVINPAQAQAIFDAIQQDAVWPFPSATISGPSLRTAPGEVSVRVLNATGVPGAAGTVADGLRSLGFRVVGVNTAPSTSSATVVRFAPDRNESARTLIASVSVATSEPDASLGGILELVVGRDFQGLRRVTVPGHKTAGSPSSIVTADIKGCI